MKEVQGSKNLIFLSLFFLSVTFYLVLFNREVQSIPESAYCFTQIWLIIAIISAIFSCRDFSSGTLICLFSMLISWRITQTYTIEFIIYPYFMAFICLLSNFFYCAYLNIKNPNDYIHKISLYGWHLVFIRMYIGFDFIPHFTEKLFAGPEPHFQDVKAFISLQIPHANLFVWLAGICEFGASIAIGIGLMMRLGALFTVLYLLIATYLGNHFALGFIWANHGGGWEFAVMWSIMIASFALIGTRDFSLDQKLREKFNWYKL